MSSKRQREETEEVSEPDSKKQKKESEIAFVEDCVERIKEGLKEVITKEQTEILSQIAARKSLREDVLLPDAKYENYIDHTVLKPETKAADVTKLCDEAKEYNFKAVCVNGCRVSQCVDELKGKQTSIASVVGFPLGAMKAEAKIHEAKVAIEDGADEIDMVINVGRLLEGNYEAVYRELKDMAEMVHSYNKKLLKVIFETGLLSDEQIVEACILCILAGADFVKTSTGFGHGGATLPHVRLMKTIVDGFCLVKASGGVRDADATSKFIAAGASRIGTSSGVKIVSGAKNEGSGY